jgi:hypothetical protein
MSDTSEGRSFWQRLFGRTKVSPLTQRQERVLRYVIGRIDEGVPLQDALEEGYVRRNCSRMEINQIAGSPDLVEAARKQMEESLGSDELRR